MTFRLGIDLGGTKIEALVLDGEGRERWRRRIPTPQGDYPATVAALCALVGEAEAATGPCHVGIGTPGSESRLTGHMKNCNSTCLNGQPLRDDLARALSRPIRLANDADCFALSEATDGAAAGEGTVFGVIIGTGCGGGIVVNGTLLSGPNGIAGEWGHIPMPGAGETARRCYCGRMNCVETFLSGEGLMRTYEALSGEHCDVPAIAAREAAGESAASRALDDYANQMARALAVVINLLDPDCIVLGGGLSNLESLYPRITARWGHHVFSDDVRTRLARARFGDSSGVRGAAWLWPAVSS